MAAHVHVSDMRLFTLVERVAVANQKIALRPSTLRLQFQRNWARAALTAMDDFGYVDAMPTTALAFQVQAIVAAATALIPCYWPGRGKDFVVARDTHYEPRTVASVALNSRHTG
jgi:hypothetical protein